MTNPMNSLKFRMQFIAAVIFLFAGPWLIAQGPDSNHVSVPLADPSRPAQVRAHLVNGSITVKAYEGKEVIVDDQVRVGTESYMRIIDLTITVPVHTSLSLHTVNDGNISVTGVDGELDVDDINGEVTLRNISGSAVAHALNGRLLVTFARVDPQKPMAFSSMNGAVDVTFPADTKANLSLRTDNGEVFSDFDIQLQNPAPQPIVEDNRGKGGKYVVRVEKTVRGTINGGGPEMQFKNFNGNIYIRKAGK